MRSTELALRKELALTHLRIARTELLLARAEKPDKLAPVSSAVDLLTSLLAQKNYGKWSTYARAALRVVHVVLGLRKVA